MLTQIEAPAVLPLSLIEAKAAARIVEGDENDALVASYLRAAVATVDGAGGWLNRCLIRQVWRLDLPHFPYCVIHLPLPPLIAVTEVAYTDQDGVTQVLDPSAYAVAGTDPGRLVTAFGQSWPATRGQLDAVRITFEAGFGPSWNDVPEDLRAAIGMLVAEHFDGCTSEAARAILFRYRSW